MHKFNPFRPGKTVAPGMFCGRAEELIAIERGLFQTKNGNPVHFLIQGERGIGKTSLLLIFDALARGLIDEDEYNFLVPSVELRDGMSFSDVLDGILIAIKNSIEEVEKFKKFYSIGLDFLKNIEVMGSRIKDSKLTDSAKFDKLAETLVSIANTEKDGKPIVDGIIILIDEADKPPAEARLGETCKLLTERLAKQGCEKVALVLAGLPSMIPRLRESHESAPRVFSILNLEPLETSEREEVISKGLELAEKTNGFKTKMTTEAKQLLSSLSEGYPHFIQEFCYCAFEADKDNTIDTDDVLDGAFSENGAIDQLGQKYYTGLYIDQINSDEYRNVLICMAESTDEWVNRKYLIDNSGVKTKTIDNALSALKDRGIILTNQRERGQYKLPTKSFAIWIKVKETAKARSPSNDGQPKLPLDEPKSTSSTK